jgi:hypothetical protein
MAGKKLERRARHHFVDRAPLFIITRSIADGIS